jgi:hypothetical protein
VEAAHHVCEVAPWGAVVSSRLLSVWPPVRPREADRAGRWRTAPVPHPPDVTYPPAAHIAERQRAATARPKRHAGRVRREPGGPGQAPSVPACTAIATDILQHLGKVTFAAHQGADLGTDLLGRDTRTDTGVVLPLEDLGVLSGPTSVVICTAGWTRPWNAYTQRTLNTGQALVRGCRRQLSNTSVSPLGLSRAPFGANPTGGVNRSSGGCVGLHVDAGVASQWFPARGVK